MVGGQCARFAMALRPGHAVGVLVSEVMSQQTQMSRVVPYWTDWMARWPDARALAEAPRPR